MQYVNLGRSGLKVSRLCLGCMSYGAPAWRDWVLDERAARPFFKAALEAGITFFDTADVYSLGVSEEIAGRALRDMARRHEVVVATKAGNPMGQKPNQRGLSRKHLMESIDASLRRLGLDYVDLYITHRWDAATPAEEAMEALNDIVRAGKALYVGASSMPAWRFVKAQSIAERNGWARFVAMQNHYNLVYREEERETIPYCLDQGVGVTPWSPLARGFLAGNRHRQGGGDTTRSKSDEQSKTYYYRDADFAIADKAGEIARRRGLKPAQVALAWLLAKPAVTAPVIGATRPEHLADLIAAAEITLDPEEIAALEAPYQPRAVAGHAP